MKVATWRGAARFTVDDVPDPAPGPGQALVAVHAAGICGTDVHATQGLFPWKPPLVMGHETVGRIGAVGTGVDPERLGQRVVLKPIVSCGRCDACLAGDINRCREGRLVGRDLAGGFAERFAVPATAAVPVPAELPDDAAVLTEPRSRPANHGTRGRRRSSCATCGICITAEMP